MIDVVRTRIDGCLKIKCNVFQDQRGESIKIFHKSRFRLLGLECDFQEDLIVRSGKNVLRGLHYQGPTNAQKKLICCLSGAIQDVVLDIRVGSKTYGLYEIFTLNDKEGEMLLLDEGLAHGYLTLQENSIVIYKMSSEYDCNNEGGVLWNSLGIPWESKIPIISTRDADFPKFDAFQSPFTLRQEY